MDSVIKNTLVPLILRLGLAVIFIFHGLGKLNQENEWGANWERHLGDQAPPKSVQLAVTWAELIGGIALALGFLTRLAALGIIAIQAGAIYTVTGKNGFSILHEGYEYNVALIVMAVAVVLLGGGTLAVDRFFRLRRKRAA
jgi:putative oxidoreductase